MADYKHIVMLRIDELAIFDGALTDDEIAFFQITNGIKREQIQWLLQS